MSGEFVVPPIRRLLAGVTCGVLVVALSSEPAAAGVLTLQKGQVDRPIPGQVVKAKLRPADPAEAAAVKTLSRKAAVWPKQSTVDIDLGAVAASGSARGVKAGDLPVWIEGATTAGQAGDAWRIRVHGYGRDKAETAGVDGLVMRLEPLGDSPAGSHVRVGVDYAGFANAYGASWAGRLRLVRLPACALTTPTAAGCSEVTALPSRNDVGSKRVSATVPVSEAVVALMAGPSGSDGDFAATSLSPSSTWSAGAHSGDFTWSYPIAVPPSPGGPAPKITLSYSAQAVDGRTAATNNQPSWLGEGFEWWPGYIERRYRPCAEDIENPGRNNAVKTGDQCWETDNATLSMSGRSGELIKDATDPGRWHLRGEDGSLIQRKTGGGNGDNDGEWWVVTDRQGTQYWFGGQPSANSTWTAPVFGNDPGEPCRQTTFAASSCARAWRWNLDRVVDVLGNTMSYTYVKETNRYGRNLTASDAVVYDRGGYLAAIEYGTRNGVAGSAPMRVEFEVAERCIGACVKSDPATYPDTPVDQECTGAPCNDVSPTFWSTKRLASITTRVWDPNKQPAAGYKDVRRWTFTHTFPDPGDSSRAGLWLSRISQVGLVGETTTVPDIVLSGTQLQNRVDTIGDQLFPMNWWRISRIDTETGGAVVVNYERQECVAGSVMPDVNALQDNTLRCFPVKWTPDGYQNPITDFFHKYVVAEVREGDLVGKAPDVINRYEYLGGGAWHYTDDDGLTKPEYRTWSGWRGYATVRTRQGDPAKTMQTLSESRFFRGMHGDHLPFGTRTVTVPAVDVNGDGDTTDAGVDSVAVPDEDAYAGMTRATITYNGNSGPEVSATINEPWQSAPTASRAINASTVHARFAALATVHGRVALDTDGGTRAAGWRTASRHTVFDEHGLTIEVDDRGDDVVIDDQKCTLTEYTRKIDPANGVWLTEFIKRTRTFAVDCQTAKMAPQLSEDDIIGEARSLYDGAGYGVAPSRGLVTEVQQLKSYTGGTPAFVTVSRTQHDAYGRVTDSWDVDNRHTSIAYAPADGPMTQLVTTNPLGWTTTTVLEPAWGTPMAVTDVNGKLTQATRDGLGRTTQVWKPGRSRAAGHTPHTTYTYRVRTDGANSVTTYQINAAGTGYITTVALLDGLLRPRQTQSQDAAVAGARIVADTLYDSAGRAFQTTNPYTMTGAPSQDLYEPKPPQYSGPEALPGWTLNLYDGAGRVTDSILYSRNVEKWRTRTAYTGDRVDVTPPVGGTATSTLTDAAGRTVGLRQYHGPTPLGARDTTTYDYNRKDQLARVTDPMGNHWDYRYDLRGRQVEVDDPDAGQTTTTFDDAGRIVTRTDGRNITIAYTYDGLGRKTTIRDGSVTGDKRAEWFYDSVAKGQLSKSTRYVKRDTVFDAYSIEILSYGHLYQPGIVRYVLPSSETGFGTSMFSYAHGYNTDGSLSTLRIPAAGGLPLETANLGYNDLSLPTTLSSGGTLVTATGYTNYGEPNILTLQHDSGRVAQVGYYYKDDGTRRLNEIKSTSAAAPTTTYSDLFYDYDPAGNIIKMVDTVSGDNQCFDYDQLRRLTQAWTSGNGDCGAVPSLAGLGGPAKYWQQWTFDQVGNRRTQTDHVSNTTATYAYPAAGAPQPHALSQVDYAGSVTRTDAYQYDAAGNTRIRPGLSGSQTLTWDGEGHLERASDATGTTTFIYDADGNRLLRKDPSGKTLYLLNQEVRYTNSSGIATCTRYYTHLGINIAMRTSAGLSWLSGDAQNTSILAITANNQTTAQRWMNPYGNQRGSTGTWPASMDKGLVGGTQDNSGLTHLGAREYDSTLGRFISVDPIMDLADPQQWHAYSYANNTPITASDPSGLCSAWVDGEFCGDSPPPGPSNAVVSVTPVNPKVTTRVYKDGTVRINGYVLPEGTVDLDLLEQRMRELSDKVGFEDSELGIIRLIAQACSTGTDVCDVTVYRAVVHDLNLGELLDRVDKDGWTSATRVDYDMLMTGSLLASAGISTVGEAPGLPFGRGYGKTRSGCQVNSFDLETEVLMADGSHTKIKDVRPGDMVVATDPETGHTAAKEVTARIEGQGQKDLVRVTIDDAEGGDAVIIATAEHPFWVDDQQLWIDADALRPGMKLRASNGLTVTVAAVSGYQGWKRVNNLTVADIHTYYVLAGNTPVLVHNTKKFCGADASALNEWDKATFETVEESAEYHLARHGKGRTLAEYTQEARDLWNKTKPQDRVPWRLGDGSMGWKIRGDWRGGEGIYTQNGKIVTWHD